MKHIKKFENIEWNFDEEEYGNEKFGIIKLSTISTGKYYYTVSTINKKLAYFDFNVENFVEDENSKILDNIVDISDNDIEKMNNGEISIHIFYMNKGDDIVNIIKYTLREVHYHLKNNLDFLKK